MSITVEKKMTIVDRQGGGERTYRLQPGRTAEWLARAYLKMQGALESVERRVDEDTVYTLRDLVTGRELSPDTVLWDVQTEDVGRYEVVHEDTAGQGAR